MFALSAAHIRPLALLLTAMILAALPMLPASASGASIAVETTEIAPELYLLTGRGGNVLASVGDEGVLLIDDDYAQIQPAYAEALKALGAEEVRYIINTHWHGDHTGANAIWASAGSVIVAHDNVRKRMATRQENTFFGGVTEPSPDEALPQLTYGATLTMHINGLTAEVRHLRAGHTDGDSIVYFPEVNVLHMGDIFFNPRYPYVDMDAGGSVEGIIAAVELVLDTIDDDTVIVPGHGVVGNRDDLALYLEMLLSTRSAVKSMLASGMGLPEIAAAGLDQRWAGWGDFFISEERWIQTLIASLLTPGPSKAASDETPDG